MWTVCLHSPKADVLNQRFMYKSEVRQKLKRWYLRHGSSIVIHTQVKIPNNP
jgi:hypothetical protein